MRDINEYAKNYQEESFETWKVYYRRKKILELIDKYHPKTVLEIGCGEQPLFLYTKQPDIEWTVVEPADEFFWNAKKNGEGKSVRCIQGFFEEVTNQLTGGYNMIICASLLHEVSRPEGLLEAISKVCDKDSKVVVIVPNGNSMHRILGQQIGILKSTTEFTEGNKRFQQHTVFTRDSFNALIEKEFSIIEDGSFFVKPFSHSQMQLMMETGIIDKNVLDGLYRLADKMPDVASELWMIGQLKD